MGWRIAFVIAAFAQPAAASSFRWKAPSGCPTEEAVRTRLERDFGPELDAASGVEFEGVVNERGGAFELLLTARRGDGAAQERRIRAATCAELVDALVAAMSLAVQSLDTSAESAPPVRPDEPAPERSPEPSPAARSTEDAPKPVEPRGSELVPTVALGALLDVGALPDPAFGVEALVGLRFSHVDVSLLGALTVPRRSTFDDAGGGEFDLAFGGASICYVPARSVWELGACFAGEVGRLHGAGWNVDNPREGSSLWLALVPAVRLAVRPLGAWGFFAQAGAVVPLARRPFELSEVGVVHEPAAVGFRALAGIELGFP